MALAMTDNLFKRITEPHATVHDPAEGLSEAEREVYQINGLEFVQAFRCWVPFLGLPEENEIRAKLEAQFEIQGNAANNVSVLRNLLAGLTNAGARALWLDVFESTFRRMDVESAWIEEGFDPDTDPRFFGYHIAATALAAIQRVS